MNPQNKSHYIKTECFAFPTPGTMLGDGGRNSIIGPGIRDADLSLMKNNKITERLSAQFRADFFNIFNFVNYATPVKSSTQLFNQAGAPIADSDFNVIAPDSVRDQADFLSREHRRELESFENRELDRVLTVVLVGTLTSIGLEHTMQCKQKDECGWFHIFARSWAMKTPVVGDACHEMVS